MLLAALTFFTIGSVICGMAGHITVLLIGRSVQGAGGGGLLTMTYVLMTDFCSLQERHIAITALSLTWLVGVVVGPVVSGVLAEHSEWRIIFWLNLPFAFFSYIVIIFFIRTTYVPSQPRLSGLRHIDWLGSTLFVASITAFLIPLSWGGTMYPWTSWHTAVPLSLGIMGMLTWFAYSFLISARPMIPLSIMANRTAALHYLGNLVHGIVQFGGLYYLPLYYQTVLDYSPTVAGVAMLPQCVIAAPFSALAAVVIAKTNSVKTLIIASWICLTGGTALFRLLATDTPVIRWICLQIPSAMGIGSLFGGLALATQAAAETNDTRSAEEVQKVKGMAASLNPFFRTLGQALGIVIAQAAFTNQMSKRAGPQYANDAASLGQVLSRLPNGSPLRVKLTEDYNDSLHTVWWVLCAIAGTMMVLTLFVKDVGPSGENEGFFLGFGRLKGRQSRVKIVHPSFRAVAMMQERQEAVMKEPGWGIRKVRRASEDSAFHSSTSSSPSKYDRAARMEYDGDYAPYRQSRDRLVYPSPERYHHKDVQGTGIFAPVAHHNTKDAAYTPRPNLHRSREPTSYCGNQQHDEVHEQLLPRSTPPRSTRIHLPRWQPNAAIENETFLPRTPERFYTPSQRQQQRQQQHQWQTSNPMSGPGYGVMPTGARELQTCGAGVSGSGHGRADSVTSEVLQLMGPEEEVVVEEQPTPTRKGGRGGRLGHRGV